MNKHKYSLKDGTTPLSGSDALGWVFVDAMIQVKCPKCESDAGFYCETQSGRKVKYAHSQRVVKLLKVK